MTDLAASIQGLTVWILPVVFAITLHEAAHALMADWRGDDTARRLGRVTLNPVRHVDPIGTIVLPGILLLTGSPFLFGWAKPVPVAFHRLRHPKQDMVWVALAGPGINVALALLCGLALHLVFGQVNAVALWSSENLQNAIFINLMLAIFNMLPILPLDGGRVLAGLLPLRYAIPFARTERYGLLVVMSLLILVPLITNELGAPFNPIAELIGPVLSAAARLVFTVTGWPV